MLKPRFALMFSVLVFATLSSSAQATTNTVKFGKHQAHPTRLIAKYKQNINLQSQANGLATAGATVRKRMNIVNGLVTLDVQGLPPESAAASVRADALANKIQTLRNSGLFEYVEPDYVVTANLQPNDSRFQDGTLWGLRNLGGLGGIIGADINAEQAWNLTTGSTNVVVAVIDTGVRYTHQDLADQMWRNPGEIPGNGIDDDANGYVDDVFGINAITGTGNPLDDNDHGTHCSGTIGARANGGGGHVGVTWNVRIMALKFLGAGNTGFTSDGIECLNYAVSKGAKISNNSWGGGSYSQALFDAIVAARNAGHLFIAAAGNSANDNDANPSYPASYKLDNIISVAAIDRADRLAVFSNYGQDSVHLGAPGVAIYSTTATTDSSYSSFQGTSMAAPHVTGVAALLLAQTPTANYLEIRERLLASTVPINSLFGRCVTGGRLNAYNALVALPDGQLEVSVSPPGGSVFVTGSVAPFFVRVTDLFGITNATVTATTSLGGSITFANNGTLPDLISGDAIYSGNYTVPNSVTNVTITLVASAPGKIGLTNVLDYSIVAPPTNDNFVAASKIPNAGGSVVALNTFASIESGEPIHAGIPSVAASLWWNWSASATGPVLVDTTGSSFDTVLAVYTGTNVAALTQLAAVDDAPNSAAGYLYFNAIAANTYRIVVAGYDTNQTGSIRLRLTPNGVPDTNAPSLTVTSHLSGANVNTNRITVAGTATDPTPNSSGLSEVQVRVNGVTPVNTANGTATWTAPVLLQLGANTIEVWAYDNGGNLSPTTTLTINYFPLPPANDHFVQAINITNYSGNSSVSDTALATKEYNEPNHAGNVGGKSVWWKFVAPTDGVFSVSTTNSTFDTLLAIYSGNAVGSLTNIASNDDSSFGSFSEIIIPVLAGRTNYIAVDGYAGSVGAVNLSYSFSTSQVYSVVVTVSGNGTVSPTTLLYASNSLATLTGTPGLNSVFNQWSGGILSVVNPLVFNVRSNISITAQFTSKPYADGFEAGNFSSLDWTSSGTPWIVQSTNVSAGSFAARSGVISHNQSSSLILTGNFRAGSVSFDLNVISEPFWDVLKLIVDGSQINQWSGEVPWQSYAFPITAGSHTIEWRYSKDNNTSSGFDAASIDNLDIPLNVAIGATTPGTLSLRRMSDHSYVVDLVGQLNQTYITETSSDLTTWTPLSTNVLLGGSAHIADPASATNAPRYYRARVTVP